MNTTTTAKVAPHVGRDGLRYDVQAIAEGYIAEFQSMGRKFPSTFTCSACDHKSVTIDSLANSTDARLLAELMVHADTAHGIYGDVVESRISTRLTLAV